MNGLPFDIDLGAFINADVIQICFGGTNLIVKFDKEIDLTIESRCKLALPGLPSELVDNFRSRATQICGLLGEQVRRANRDDQGGLRLEFQSGAVFQVMNDSVAYETFQLRLGSEMFYA